MKATYMIVAIVAAVMLVTATLALTPISSVFANNEYTAEETGRALQDMTPYTTIDEKMLVTLDTILAGEDGVSQRSIQIATDYAKAQNNMIQRIHDDPTKRMYLDERDTEKFGSWKEKIREGKMNGDSTSVLAMLGLVQYASAQTVCGGGPDDPHTQPGTTYSYDELGYYFTSWNQALQALTNNGYHLVPQYASNNYGTDYHDPRTLFSCTTDSFRYQSIILGSGSLYYHSQHHSPGEPNPEVLGAYTWPAWWWGSYVADWHGFD